MKKAGIALVFLWLLVYLLPLGVLPLGSPDEARYAEIAREMLDTGDHVVPRLNGLLYLEKPPLDYWITGVSLAVLGMNNLAVRLQAAVAAGLTMLILGLLVRRQTGDGREGLLTAAIYGSSVMVFGLGSVAAPDSQLTLFLTGTLAAGMCALDESRLRQRAWWLVLAGVSAGLAFLTKGFLAVVLPGMVMGAWLAFSPHRRRMVTLAWLPFLATFVTVLPWGVLMHLRQPGFWSDFIWVEHVERFLAPAAAARHPEPVWYYLPILAYGTMPWLVVLPAALAGLRGQLHRNSLAFRAALWLVLPLLFFSASRGKLPTYILPIFPPLAILTAAGLIQMIRQGRGRRLFNAGVAVGGVAAMTVIPAVWVRARPYYGPGEEWKWVVMMVTLACWAGASLVAYRSPSHPRAVGALVAAPLALFFACHFLYPSTVHSGPSLGAFIQEHRDAIPVTARVIADTETVHGACWYLQRQDLTLFPEGGELTYGLQRTPESRRLVDEVGLAEWILDPRRQQDLVLLLDEEKSARRLQAAVAELPVQPTTRREGLGFLLLAYPAMQ